ncbi:MAG: hypothetical protein ACFNUI_09440, partial [Negativicutes bacterium]
MTWSQENCLINDRRLTCERWGRGFATSLLFLAFGEENIIARSGPSTRRVSADNTICDGHQHIRREGRFIPVVMVYGKT